MTWAEHEASQDYGSGNVRIAICFSSALKEKLGVVKHCSQHCLQQTHRL